MKNNRPLFRKFHIPDRYPGKPLGRANSVGMTNREYLESELNRLLGENRRYAALLEAIFAADPGGLAVVAGPDLRFAFANPAYRYICPNLGQDPTGLPYEAVWPVDDGNSFHAQILSVLNTGRPYQYPEFQRDYPDGTRRFFTFQARRIEWGSELAALLIFWDTTDLIHSQRQLVRLLEETHHQGELMQGLFNAMSDAVMVLDPQGVILNANSALIQTVGFDPTGKRREEVTAKIAIRWPDGRLMEPDQLPSARSLRGEKIVGERIRLDTPAGGTYFLDVTASPLNDANGQVMGVLVVWHDVTEQEQYEESLRESEARYRELSDSITDLFYAYDADFRLTYRNKAAEKTTHIPTSEALGKTFAELYPSMVGSEAHLAYLRALETRQPQNFMSQWVRPQDGRTLFFDINVYPTRQGIAVLSKDITERIETEQLAAAQQEWLRTTLSSIGDAVITADAAGKVTFLNPVAEQLTGWQLTEAVGQPLESVFRIINEQTRQPVEDPVRKVLELGTVVGLANHTTLIARDGREIPIEDSAAPIVDRPRSAEATGRILGVVLVFHDVTEKRRADEALRKSENENRRQREFLEAQSAVDPGGQAVVAGKELIIRYTNPSYRAITPHPEKEPLGQPYEMIWPPEEGFTQSRLIRQVIRDQKDLHIQRHERRMPDGTTHYFTFHIHPMEWEGQPAAYLVLWDTTEMVQAEEKLRLQNRQIELSYEPIFTWELEGGIVSWNEGCEQLYGYRKAEAIGRSSHDLLQTRFPVSQAETEARLRSEGTWSGELRHITRDGREIFVESRQQLITTDGRTVVLEANRDITVRKQIEQRLAAEREWFNITLASIGDAVITCDPQGRVTFLNPVAEQITGWGAAEAVGQPIERVFHIINEQTRLEAVNPVERVLREGIILGLANHTALIDRQGVEKPIEDSAAPIVDHSRSADAAGSILGVVMVFRDVAEKRKAEQALQESRMLLQAVIEEAPDPIFLKDKDSRVLLANSATFRVVGKPAEQVIGKTDAEFYDDPEVGRSIIENDRRVMESGQIQVIEERVIQPGEPPENERVYLSTKKPYRDASGEVVGIIGVSREITGLKERERELNRLNRTLKALNKSNQAMMRADDEQAFMQEVCRIITEDCGYAMVWIGLAEEDEAKTVRPVAYAGFEDGYLETLHVTWADTERGRGPTGTAIRTGQPATCRNMLTDPRFAPWRKEAQKRGYASSLVLPMLAAGKAFGAITIYSRQPDAFREDEVSLLNELASDLGYGITAMRTRLNQARVEQALRESEERYRSLFQGMTEGFALHEVICDENGVPADYRFLEVNPAFEHLTGLKAADLKGKRYSQIEQLREDGSRWVDAYGKVALTGEPVHFENYSPGLKHYYEVFAYRPAALQFAVLFMDITERKQTELDLRQAREAAEKNRTQIEVQRRLIEQREQERQRIARDLHDGPVQIITSATYSIQGLSMSILDEQQVKELESVRAMLQDAIGELRAYAQELRPPVLFSFGLRRAIQSHLEGFQEKHPELHIQLEVDWTGELLPEQISIALFRVYQESLTNIIKHARARQVRVHLARKDDQVTMFIQDDGAGFILPGDLSHLAREGHLGLVGIRERVEAIDGTLQLDSEPGKGTKIQVEVPLR